MRKMKDIIIKNADYRNKLTEVLSSENLHLQLMFFQHQYLKAILFQKINKPNVKIVKNVSPAIVITLDEK